MLAAASLPAPAPAAAPAPVPAPAQASAQAPAAELPSALYDKPGVIHNEQCVHSTDDQPVPVRDLEGNPLETYGGAVSDPMQQGETCALAPGVRLEGIESLSGGGLAMYYSWPLEGGLQFPGFIAAGELASQPALDPADAAGNGAPAPPAPGEPVYAIVPQDIAHEQRYEGPAGTPARRRRARPGAGRWYTYSVYGRPVGGARFALMTWSWVDVSGGGIARAAVSQGELFHPADVSPISLYTSAGAGQPANGEVTARYGYVWDGVQRVYGWMVVSHTFGETCFDHMAYAGGGPPLAGTLCPEGMLRDSIEDVPLLGGGAGGG